MVHFTVPLLVDLFAGCNFGLSLLNLQANFINAYVYSDQGVIATQLQKDVLNIAFLLGSMLGSLFIIKAMASYGRKRIAVPVSIVGCIFNLLAIIQTHWAFLFVCRFVIGVCASMLTSVAPAWMAEISESPKQRVILTGFFQVFISIGFLIDPLILMWIAMSTLNKYFEKAQEKVKYWYCYSDYIYLNWLPAAICLALCAILSIFLPDPTYDKLQELKKRDSEVKSFSIGIKQLFSRKYAIPVINAFLIAAAQQAVGSNGVLAYATEILKPGYDVEHPDSYDSQMAAVYGQLITNSAMLFFVLIAVPFVSRLNRRTLWFAGYFFGIIGNLLLIINYAVWPQNSSNNGNIYMTVIGSLVLLFGFQIGPGLCLYSLMSELFPMVTKSWLTCIAFFMKWLLNIVVVLIQPRFKEGLQWAAFLIYTIMTLPMVGVMWYTVPETKGKTLQEIEKICVKQDPSDQEQSNENQKLLSQDVSVQEEQIK